MVDIKYESCDMKKEGKIMCTIYNPFTSTIYKCLFWKSYVSVLMGLCIIHKMLAKSGMGMERDFSWDVYTLLHIINRRV